MAIELPIRAVSKLTGVATETLRAWERRYRAVNPRKGKRGRISTESDVQRLLLLRSAMEMGLGIGQAARMPDGELKKLLRKTESMREVSSASSHVDERLRAVFEAVSRYDFEGANGALLRLALSMERTDLVHKVVVPAMRLAGELCEKGVIPAAQEHMLTACIRNLLGGLLQLGGAKGRGGVRLLLTTPSGELHEIGIMAAATLAAWRGAELSYLGPSLEWREIRVAAEGSLPDAVVLSVSHAKDLSTVRLELRMLASSLPEEVELWIGGERAPEALEGVSGRAVVRLEGLEDFARHLERMQAMAGRASPGHLFINLSGQTMNAE